jgi:hypothetical protein
MHSPSHQDTGKKGCPPLAGILLAASVVLAATLLQSIAGLPDLLQWTRGAGPGLSWITAHLCHWSWNHLAWDVAVFAILSVLALRLAASRYAICLIISSALIVLEVQCCQHSLIAYRGLSGIDCALVGLIVAALWRMKSSASSKFLAFTATLGFVAKSLYELTTDSTIFVDHSQTSAQFVPVVSAHLVGFTTGLIVGLWKRFMIPVVGAKAFADLRVCSVREPQNPPIA